VYCQLPRQRAAAADLHHVAEHFAARRFADDAPVDLLFPGVQHFHDAPRAVHRRAFLVARKQERDRAGMLRIAGDEALGRRDHRSQAALHVGSAAAVQNAVLDDRLERVGVPFLARAGRNDVGVAGEAEQGATVAAAGPDVFHGTERHAFHIEAQRFEPCADDLQASLVVGAHGRTPDQFAGQCQGVGRRVGRGQVRSSGWVEGGATYNEGSRQRQGSRRRCAPNSRARVICL
jgi:hypothetical protein